MTVRILCPTCLQGVQVPSKYRGKAIRCPGCRAPLTVPADENQMEIPQPPTPPPFAESLPEAQAEVTHGSPTLLPELPRSKPWPLLIGTAAIFLITGYYAGREHLKWEIRKSFNEASLVLGESIRENFIADDTSGDVADSLAATHESIFDGPITEQPHPILAIGQGYAGAGFSIALTGVRLDYADVKSSLGGTYESDEKLLLLNFKIVNTEDRKVLEFRGDSRYYPSNFSLVDDVKNRIFGGREVIGSLSAYEDIPPGEYRTHIQAFDAPLPKTEYLLLSVDLQALSSEGRIKYKIPVSQIANYST